MLTVEPVPLTARTLPPEPFVLLVDDHEPSLWNLQKVLQCEGYACVATPCPTHALALCDGRRPGLVVTDLAMPRLDGLGLARVLRARHPNLPIVLITGELIDPSTEALFRGTFARRFAKPIDLGPFLSAVAGLMPPTCRRGCR
jgi:CheY-like chemotaxis protein